MGGRHFGLCMSNAAWYAIRTTGPNKFHTHQHVLANVAQLGLHRLLVRHGHLRLLSIQIMRVLFDGSDLWFTLSIYRKRRRTQAQLKSTAAMLATKYGPDYAERRNTAFHEAGHAVASYRLPHADKVTRVTVVETDDEAGHSSIRRLGIQTLNTWRDNICALLGELLRLAVPPPSCSTGSKPGCEDDVLQARGEAKKVAQYGRGELSVADLKRRIERVMAQEEKRAVALTRLYAPKVRLVAVMLQQQDELTHEQIVQIIGPIPEKPSMWTRMKELLGCCRRPNP
ncbi:hypothetical protein GPALN_014675 [Globodera pallida]|nr:hypothetical protein GPALN_014675 [Globodera pallida]